MYSVPECMFCMYILLYYLPLAYIPGTWSYRARGSSGWVVGGGGGSWLHYEFMCLPPLLFAFVEFRVSVEISFSVSRPGHAYILLTLTSQPTCHMLLSIPGTLSLVELLCVVGCTRHVCIVSILMSNTNDNIIILKRLNYKKKYPDYTWTSDFFGTRRIHALMQQLFKSVSAFFLKYNFVVRRILT